MAAISRVDPGWGCGRLQVSIAMNVMVRSLRWPYLALRRCWRLVKYLIKGSTCPFCRFHRSHKNVTTFLYHGLWIGPSVLSPHFSCCPRQTHGRKQTSSCSPMQKTLTSSVLPDTCLVEREWSFDLAPGAHPLTQLLRCCPHIR